VTAVGFWSPARAFFASLEIVVEALMTTREPAIAEWDYNDVSTHASAIPARLRNGTMPCDGPWPAGQVETFQRWVDSASHHE
jgi:hypothetical protein